jgi:uncharacterized protein
MIKDVERSRFAAEKP